MDKKVVYTGPQESLWVVEEELAGVADVIRVEPTPEELLSAFEQASGFLDASMKVRIPAETIEAAKDLKVISTATTGADHIAKDALEKRGIPLLTLKGQKEVLHGLTGAAEHSWLLLMMCARNVRDAIHHVENGGWERTEFPGIMLKNKTLGLIGFGRIGSWMAKYAAGFDMNVIAFDPFVTEAPDGIKMVSKEEALSQADFVSVHVHLSDETKHLINTEAVEKMKDGVTIINTSRGDIVDEDALVSGLESGKIKAVGVDVLTDEPEVQSRPLYAYSKNHNNVIITPHIGGFCPESVDITVRFAAERIKNIIA
ncbi:MAG: hypothetical protein CMI52_03330 [Parcubacteria group bacterium]|nr:hypothetical protein [Parcubacteria group bacterium]